MGVCGFCLIGKKQEIEKLGEICNRVGALLKAKFSKGTEEFFDWTGISIFEIFQNLDECSSLDSAVNGKNSEKEKAMGLTGRERWKKDEAAIWWWEIAWPHKIPSEVWQMMRRKGKRCKVHRLVNKMIRDLSKEDDIIFDHLEKESRKQGSGIRYSHHLF
jgi:hypothetical protein